jgi:hypothetical protein
MRSLVSLAAVTGALLGAACTNDYDALLEAASGGGSAASTADAGSTTSDASSSSASASGSTTTDASSAASTTSTAAGDGGGGNGDGGGTGGTGEGAGGAGAGGAEASIQCPGFQVKFDAGLDLERLDNGWDPFSGAAELESTADGLGIDLEDVELSFGFLVRDTDPGAIEGCSVETAVLRLPQLANAEAEDEVAAMVGLGRGDELQVALYVGRFTSDEGSVEPQYGIVFRDESVDGDYRNAPAPGPVGPLPIALRVRGITDDRVRFQARREDGDWEDVGAEIDVGELESPPDTVMVGAIRSRNGASNEGDPEAALLGTINPDVP